ncbi:MAG: carbohydrate kinase [Bacteroidetes bacterium]|nr:carbohydrate kinase [Bacteroidota bacterium]
MYLIGYDIGSSIIKASLVEAASGRHVDTVQYPEREMDIISRQKGWAEQQPELWWQNLCQATRKLLHNTRVDPATVKAVGISYQMHGLVLVDKDQQVLRPSIIWCDSRAVSIGSQAFAELGERYCLENFLNSPGNFTASKLKWVKDHEPALYRQIHKALLPGDYIAMKFTGQMSTTISGLSEAVLWNFKEKRLATEILDYYKLDKELLPDVRPTFSITGEISRKAAAETGLAPGTAVSYRAGDQPNNAMSLHVLEQGEVAATSGTSGVVYGILDRPLYDEESRVNAFAHVNYEENFDRIGMLLCINGAGIEYSWIKHQLALSTTTYEDMERMAASVPVGAEGVCLLPFGNGAERIFNNQNLDAHILHLQFNRHTRAHLYRAALEGVAFTFVHGIKLLKEMGLRLDVLRVANDNMFRSEIFSSTIATLLGAEIQVVDTIGAVGAARASGLGVGVYESLQEAMQQNEVSRVYEPNLSLAACEQAYSFWESSLKNAFPDQADKKRETHQLKGQLKQREKELRSKQKLLTAQSIELSAQAKRIRELSQKIDKLKKTGTESTEKPKKSRVVSAPDSGLLEEHVELLSDPWVIRLKEQFPKLSFEDLKLCYLLKLRLSTKEVASRLNISNRGVETRRYRLRKKLELDRSQHLAEFIDEMSF